MQSIGAAGLTAKLSKYHLGYGENKYLGYILGSGKIRLMVDKVRALAELPVLMTEKQLKSFVGLVHY